MKGCLAALGIFAGLVTGGIVLFWLNFYHIHVRYRLTVEVQEGDQIKTGSSVIEVSYSMQPDRAVSLGGPNTHPLPVGYAPTVDLGEKGMLFLTLVNATRTPDQIRARTKQVFCPLGCAAEAAVASTEAVWAAAASEALQLAVGFAVLRLASADFAVRRLTSAALAAATTLPAVAVDDLPGAVIAMDTVMA